MPIISDTCRPCHPRSSFVHPSPPPPPHPRPLPPPYNPTPSISTGLPHPPSSLLLPPSSAAAAAAVSETRNFQISPPTPKDRSPIETGDKGAKRVRLPRAMRVPVTSQPQTTAAAAAAQSLKPASAAAPPPLCYEPTSVLDLRSPASDKHPEVSALTGGGGGGGGGGDGEDGSAALHWDEHVLQTLDWDSIMRDLGLHDDSVPPFKANPHVCPSDAFPPPPPPPQHQQQQQHHHHHHLEPPGHFLPHDFALSDAYPNPLDSCADSPAGWNGGLGPDFFGELIQAAECFDSSELQLAQMILARLNQRLRSPAGKPLQRAAFYFKEAFQSLLLLQSGSNRAPARLSSWPDIVQTIRAYKAFSGNSPISMFTQFTAIQALLESFDGSMLFHVVDFDIGFGGHYASFMKEIAERADSCKVQPPIVRITAVVPEEFAIETKLIRDNLSQYAHELKLRCDVEFVLVRTFEMLSFKSIRFVDGESLAVHLSPAILHRLGPASNVARFLGDVRRLNPSIVVFVDTEPWADAAPPASFKRSFLGCFEHYATVFESVDAATGGGDWARKIEAYLLRPRIAAAVEAAAARRAAPPWREAFHGAGMRAVRLSQFADYQAECLLGKVQVRGFRVAKRQAELVLCWHDRALVATSAWRF
ncbi:scarecrow-like protein 15 [Syzygium oleosum]|uniref:scarecrow-like protein 15 n=1 Tax=Syzygium oleosum TaxID=219896 RepID=UPI0024BA958B|nr:scarecrow-like protein 15 [Syzygium oleosum]